MLWDGLIRRGELYRSFPSRDSSGDHQTTTSAAAGGRRKDCRIKIKQRQASKDKTRASSGFTTLDGGLVYINNLIVTSAEKGSRYLSTLSRLQSRDISELSTLLFKSVVGNNAVK